MSNFNDHCDRSILAFLRTGAEPTITEAQTKSGVYARLLNRRLARKVPGARKGTWVIAANV